MPAPNQTLVLALPDDAQATPNAPLPPREENEPARWHSRFCAYALAGPARSLDSTWRQEGGGKGNKGQAPGAWRRAASRFNWLERSARWDAESLAREAEALATRRRTERGRRRDVAAKLLGKLDTLLDSFVFEEAPAGVTAAVLKAAEFHEKEFGRDLDEQEAEDAALVPATAAAPSLTLIVNGEVRRFEVPAEGVVEPETDGV